jgi:hypothetical protein
MGSGGGDGANNVADAEAQARDRRFREACLRAMAAGDAGHLHANPGTGGHVPLTADEPVRHEPVSTDSGIPAVLAAGSDSDGGPCRIPGGIGTLGEKYIHGVLKYYMEPDPAYHERKVGRYVADILRDGCVTEIQTGAFWRMRKKLEYFLPDHTVTVVCPIPRKKRLYRVDVDTGEKSGGRKTPLNGTFYHIFDELYSIKMFLAHPNLRLHLLLYDATDILYVQGSQALRKWGKRRRESIPEALVGEMTIGCAGDYGQFVPACLARPFTSADYRKVTGLRLGQAQTALNVLHEMGAVRRVGKSGQWYLYE